jgi:hypothetical protein
MHLSPSARDQAIALLNERQVYGNLTATEGAAFSSSGSRYENHVELTGIARFCTRPKRSGRQSAKPVEYRTDR